MDRSRNLVDPAALVRPGLRPVDREGDRWRVAGLEVRSTRPGPVDGVSRDRPALLRFRAGLRIGPVDRTLRNLAGALVVLSATVWILTASVGRRLCRRTLAPLTRMAATARALGVAEPGRRLPAPDTGDELDDLAAAFNGLLDRWQEALERQSRFAGDASHQLRTPLAALIGQVDVALRRDRPPEDYRLALARARDQAGRLARIVESLLFLARADAEADLPELELIDLGSWVDEQLRLRGDLDGVAARVGPPPGSPPFVARAHPALLAEAFANLLDNARDHGKAGEPAEVRLDREPGRVVLSVADRGRGIEPADLPRIFDPFYRSAVARRGRPEGLGLGLAVARRIASALGGTLEAESHPGRGCRMILKLPES